MEGTKKDTWDTYKEMKICLNYDASCAFKSLKVLDLQNIKRFIFVAQSVPILQGFLFFSRELKQSIADNG